MTSTQIEAPVAALDDVGIRYGDVLALQGLSLDIGRGVTGLVGINGAGKSTLLRILSTAADPTAGSCRLFGLDPRAHRASVRRRIGYMPQTLPVPPALRVREFLVYMAWMHGVPRRERSALIDQALEDADLVALAGARVRELSGGMHRRLLLAQAVLGSPELLLLDEPTAGLDPEQRIRLRELIAALPPTGATVVSSHQMEDLVPVAGRLVMLHHGTLAFDGSVQDLEAVGRELVSDSGGLNPYEAAFLSLCSAGGTR